MTGGNPPIIRAVLMATYQLACQACRRQYQPGPALFLTGLIMLGVRPLYLEELSFQLSMGASIGIIYLLPFLTITPQPNLVAKLDFLHRQLNESATRSGFKFISDAFYCTLAAQLVITPILFLHGLPVSAVALIANPTLLWLVPIMTISGLGLMLGAILVKVGGGFGWLVLLPIPGILSGLISLFLGLLSFWGRWEAGLLTLPQSWVLALIWWGLLIAWLWWRSRR